MNLLLAVMSIYLMCAAFIAGYFAYSTWSAGRSQLIHAFSAFGALMMIYLFGYLLELNSADLDQMYFWNQVQYVGLPFYPGLWLLTALLFTRTIRSVGPTHFALLFTIPIVTFVMRATNDWHHLYYSDIHLTSMFGIPMMRLEKGVWYGVNSVYLVVCMVAVTLLYLRQMLRSKKEERGGFSTMLVASLIPYAGFLLTLLDFGRFPIDYSAFFIPPCLLVGLVAMSGGDALFVRSLARSNLFEHSPDAMLLIGQGNTLIDFNRSAASQFTQLEHSCTGENIGTIFSDMPALLDMMQYNGVREISMVQEGRLHHFEARMTDISVSDRLSVGRLISLVDMTDRKEVEETLRRSEEQLKILATTDGLTGLGNRTWFMEQGLEALERIRRTGESFAMLVLDIDHFKDVNDSHGHAAGDAVLQQISDRMRQVFRRTDIIGRIGGEEFGVILPNATREGAWLAAEKIRESIMGEPARHAGTEIHLTMSIGLAMAENRTESLEMVLKRADDALYKSKQNGRNRCTLNLQAASTGD